MAIVNKVEQKIRVSLSQTIEFQILTYCFFNDIQISNSDLKCLTELAKIKSVELTSFCNDVTNKNIFKSPQSARNAMTKAEKKNLIVKLGVNKKKISLNKAMNVQTEGLVLLDYKILGSESEAS